MFDTGLIARCFGVLIGVLASASLVNADDLSKYRPGQFGMDLTKAAAAGGMRVFFRRQGLGLFFASENDDDADGVLWSITGFDWFVHDTPDEVLDSFPKAFVYTPKHISARITAQAAGFTVHAFSGDPCGQPTFQTGADLQSPFLRPVAPNVPAGFVEHAIVPGACKKTIRNQLHQLSIHREALFPGLDGISDHIKQIIEHELE